MIAVLLGLILPVALMLFSGRTDIGRTYFLDVLINLPYVALPHWVSWGFAIKTDAQRTGGFYGSLVGANAVLVFYAFGFDHHGPELWWFFYWPFCVGAMVAGHAIGEKADDLLTSRRRGEIRDDVDLTS